MMTFRKYTTIGMNNMKENKKKNRSLAAGVILVVALVYSVSMVLIFASNFLMARKTMMEDIDALLQERVQYYDSVVSRWLDVRMEHINILKNRLENIPAEECTDDVVLEMLTESTNYGAKLGVISDYIVYTDDAMLCGDGWVPDADYKPTLKDYYIEPVKSGETYISTPYVDATTGEFIITISIPLVRNGEIFGVLARDLYISEVRAITENYKEETGSYLYVLDNEKNVLSHKNPEYAPSGEVVHNVAEFTENKFIGTLGEQETTYRGTDYDGVEKCFVEHENEQTGWIIGLSYPQSINTNRLKTILIRNIQISIPSLVVSMLLLFIFVRRKLKPIPSLVAAARQIEQGNLDITYEIQSHDEIGQLAETFRNTMNYLRGIISEIAEILQQMSEGNLDVETRQEYRGEFEKIRSAVEHISGNFNEIIGGIRVAADQVAVGSEQMAEGAQQLAVSSQEQANQVSDLVNSCNQISRIINDNAGKCRVAGDITTEVAEKLEQSNIQMKEMMEAMERISSSSRQISAVNKTIEDIAFQTNILALNAAVEAARVGDAGKGFAVVADEVRALAEKSGAAAQNTTALVEGSIHAVESGTSISDTTAESLARVVEIAGEVYRTIQDIVQLSAEQTREIEHISDGIQEISELVQSTSATAQESAASSEELSGQAQIMRDLVSRFKTK